MMIKSVLVSTFFLAFLAVVVGFLNGVSFLGGLAIFSGERVNVGDFDLGLIAPMEQTEFRVLITNETSRTVKLLGVKACCETEILAYPSELAANSSEAILGRIRVMEGNKQVVSKCVAYVELDGLIELPFRVSAKTRALHTLRKVRGSGLGDSVLDSNILPVTEDTFE